MLKLLESEVVHSPAVNMHNHSNEHRLKLIGHHETEHAVLAPLVVYHISKCRLASYVDVVALKIAVFIERAYHSHIHEMRQKGVLPSQDESCLLPRQCPCLLSHGCRGKRRVELKGGGDVLHRCVFHFLAFGRGLCAQQILLYLLEGRGRRHVKLNLRWEATASNKMLKMN